MPSLDNNGLLLPCEFKGRGKRIYLTRGFCTIVGPQDAYLDSIQWYANFSSPTQVYARNWKVGYLHRHIVQPPEGFVVDHRNGNTLDNRRENLRIVTTYQNNSNTESKGVIGLRGVTMAGRRYRARIMTPTSRKSLGCFATEEEAGAAYDAAARGIFGEFAWLNFPVAPPPLPPTDIPF